MDRREEERRRRLAQEHRERDQRRRDEADRLRKQQAERKRLQKIEQEKQQKRRRELQRQQREKQRLATGKAAGGVLTRFFSGAIKTVTGRFKSPQAAQQQQQEKQQKVQSVFRAISGTSRTLTPEEAATFARMEKNAAARKTERDAAARRRIEGYGIEPGSMSRSDGERDPDQSPRF